MRGLKKIRAVGTATVLVLALTTLSCSDSRDVLAPIAPLFDEFPAFSVSGSVTDQAGGPISGALVEALYQTTGAVAGTATTNAVGGYALTLVHEVYDFRVTPPPGSGFQVATLLGRVINADAVINFVLVPAGPVSLSGRVVDRDGRGMPSQEVKLFPYAGGSELWTYTDDEGFYSLEVAPGDYDLVVQGTNDDFPGSAPKSYQLHTRNPFSITATTTLALTLPVRRVEVHVQDPAGQPVPGVRITSDAADTGPMLVSGMEFSGASSYPESYNPPLTDASGNATLWLFPTASWSGYALTATPPEGLPFARFTIADVAVTQDLTEVIVLQFVHDPPVTVASLDPGPTPSGAYPDPVTVTLTAAAAEGFTIAGVSYRLDGGPEAAYVQPFSVAGGGTHTLEYRSVDNLGVYEAPRTLTFEIVTNQPPVAEAGGPYEVTEGTSVTLDASGSTDPDDNIVRFEWDLDGDGAFDDAAGVTTDIVLPDDGGVTVAVRVTDALGEMSTDQATVTVLNAAPVVDAGSDRASLTGETTTFVAAFSDQGTSDEHVATIDFGEGGGPEYAEVSQDGSQGSVTAQHRYLEPGVFTAEVCVTDDDGGVGCDQLTFTVSPFSILIDVKPGSEPNSIGCTNTNGTITLAIFSTTGFDATTLDPATIRFGPGEAPVRTVGNNGKLQVSESDVDGDGLADLTVQFKEAETGIVCGATEATLTAHTFDGVFVQGTDDLRTVGNPEKGKKK